METAARQSPSSPGEIAQTLDRGLCVLELLATAPNGLTVNEVAHHLSLNRTICYRLLNTLLEHHLIHRMHDGRFLPGIALLGLARQVFPTLQAVALPELRRLAEALSMTAHLTIAEGHEAVVLCTAEPGNTSMHIAYRYGARHPLEKAASGMAILAARLAQPTERPDVSIARQQGYAVSHGELQPGTSGVAIALPLTSQQIEASIGVVTVGEIDEVMIATQVKIAAQRLANALT